MISLTCPGCATQMRAVALPAADGRTLELDHCEACRLVWFDAFELGALGRAGWIHLLAAMSRADDALPAPAVGASSRCGRCPRCDEALRPTHDRTRFGDFAGLACPRGHGQAQRDGALLASRGLFRRLLPREHAALDREDRPLTCLGCGAGLPRGARACTHCRSPLVVVDLPRLAEALGLREPTAAPRGQPDTPSLRLWSCHACGAAIDVTRQSACGQCRHPVLAPRLSDLRPWLADAAARFPWDPDGAPLDEAEDRLPPERRPWRRPARPPRGLRFGPAPLDGLQALAGIAALLLVLAWWLGPR